MSHYLKVRIPDLDGAEHRPFESAFSLYNGYHSVGSPFMPKCLPGPSCSAMSSIHGSQLSICKLPLLCLLTCVESHLIIQTLLVQLQFSDCLPATRTALTNTLRTIFILNYWS